MKLDYPNTLEIANWFKVRGDKPSPCTKVAFEIYKDIQYKGKITESLSAKDREYVIKLQIDYIQKSIVNIMYEENGRVAKGLRCGYVYAISNPAWPDFVKIGCAIDVYDRLKTYQTSSPLRDYRLIAYAFTEDRLGLESKLHSMYEGNNEWVRISQEDAKILVNSQVIYPDKEIQGFCMTEVLRVAGSTPGVAKEQSHKLKVRSTLLCAASAISRYFDVGFEELVKYIKSSGSIDLHRGYVRFLPLNMKFEVLPGGFVVLI